MWILAIIIFVAVSVALWVCCIAASDADDNITEEWNKNWIGQKFKK